MDRLEEKNNLIFMLAQVVGPLTRLKDTTDANEHARIVGRFIHDAQQFRNRVATYAHSEPGHDYSLLYGRMSFGLNSVDSLINTCSQIPINAEHIVGVSQTAYPHMLAAMQLFPVVPQSQIFDAQTPFACYNFIRNLCSAASEKIAIFDRYLDSSIFHRYLTQLKMDVSVVLVTLAQAEMKGSRDIARYREFMDVSRLYAAQRGADKYQVRTLLGADFHDRWLRVDNQLFGLGGSLKDLEQRFTVSKIESSPQNLSVVDIAIAGAAEIFGPSNRTHP